MAFTRREKDGVTILEFRGRILIGVGDMELRMAVGQALEEGATKILLNLGGVTTIDSSGIGELVSSYTRVTNRGGKLKLVSVPDKVQTILQITQLITIFEIYETEDEAVKSFA